MFDRVARDSVGRSLRVLRTALGRTQDQAAQAAGITTDRLSNYETGRAIPDLAEAKAICSAMGSSPAAWCVALCLVELVPAADGGSRQGSPAEKTSARTTGRPGRGPADDRERRPATRREEVCAQLLTLGILQLLDSHST